MDTKILSLTLTALSKFAKGNFSQLEKSFLKELAEKCMNLVTYYGEANFLPFNKVTLLTTLQSLGRFQEIYMKSNEEGKTY